MALTATVAGVLGAAIGLWAGAALYNDDLERLRQDNRAAQDLLKLQADQIRKTAVESLLSLEIASAPIANSSTIATPVAQLGQAPSGPGNQRTAVNAAAGTARGTKVATPTPPAVRSPLPPVGMEALRSAAVSPIKTLASSSAQTVPASSAPSGTDPSLFSISLDDAGIAAIDTVSVTFKSGRQVAVGGAFPSGETLVSVSPANGTIVTNRRTIRLLKPGATATGTP